MKHFKTFLSICTNRILAFTFIIGVVLFNNVYAQQQNIQTPQLKITVPQVDALPLDTSDLDLNQDIAVQLISLADLYNLAVSFSPVLKYQNEIAISSNATYRLSKLEVLNRVSGFANYSTGNQALISNSSLGNETLGQIANGYRAGVNVQISLYDLFGRPQQIKQARANSKAALLQIEVLKLQLKRELTTVYQDLLISQQIMKVRIQEEQIVFTAYRVAEIEANQGRKSPTETAGIFSSYAQAKTIAEQAKGEFMKNAYYLEALVGVSIQQLKRK